jgi:tRNA (cmo5U34)-methyltransferase
LSELIRQQFDAVAQNYDNERRQLIPCFDDFYGTAASWIHTDKRNPSILDLGAGTGLFSSYARHKFPGASLTLIDLSSEMLRVARERFKNNDNVQYIKADYTQFSFDQSYDIILSSLSIHHLSHAHKSKLFHTIFRLLSNGGVFVNADQAAGSSPYFDDQYKQQWEAGVRKTELSDPVIDSAMERRKLDINATVDDQLRWLREAGFKHSDCVYKYNEFAVFYSQKG